MSQDSLVILIGLLLLVAAGVFFFGPMRRHRRERTKELQHPSTQGQAVPAVPEGEPERELATVPEQPVQAVKPPELSWFARLSNGLSKTQTQLVRQIENLFVSREERTSREALLDGMLEILVRADVGIRTSEALIEKVRTTLPPGELSNGALVLEILRKEILNILKAPLASSAHAALAPGAEAAWTLTAQNASDSPRVVLMVGVNGVGKTTTTGKLAFQQRQAGRTVIVGAADTFRAAAVDQLEEWARRAGAECVRLTEGADPASVAFECVKRAVAQRFDLCLIDTAGRLHNRQDLMQELGKIRRVAGKDVAGAPHEVLLVLDATTGQNAIQQARVFKEVAGVTGVVLTKLDGTAKGGVAIALSGEMGLPIRYVGVGETVEDLHLFNPEEFVDALFLASTQPAAQQQLQRAALQP